MEKEIKKQHNLVNDGNGFMICLDCDWSTSSLLEDPSFTPECQPTGQSANQ